MTLNMTDQSLASLTQIKEYIQVGSEIKFTSVSRKEKYTWIDNILTKFRYVRLKSKQEKGTLKEYICRMTGMKPRQLKRLVSKKIKHPTKPITVSPNWGKKNQFPVIYGSAEIILLAETDNLHSRLNAYATKEILKAEYEYGDDKYKRLKDISVSHIYNLRRKRVYESHSTTFTSTNPVSTPIGVRRKPDNLGKPGYLRVDTVHQGDRRLVTGKYEKGVYHLNLVDEVTQWEMVFCVETISELHLKPIFEQLQQMFPFRVLNFHSDNGSENINYMVSDILNRLIIKQTKSRSRHCNDNALVESKNGAVIRKHIGYTHIPKTHAPLIDEFYQAYFNPYLNFHRPCGFATTITDRKGKERKKYDAYLTPYAKFKTLENWTQYLSAGKTMKELDDVNAKYSHNAWAKLMQDSKTQLFRNIKLSEKSKMATTV
jgi:transposase InsO family protein